MPLIESSPGHGAYPWRGAEMDENRHWKKLPVSSDSVPDAPRAFHDRVRALVTSLGYYVEEETPDSANEDRHARGPGSPREGAVQGERNLVADPTGARGLRTATYGILLVGAAFVVVAIAAIAVRYAPLVPLILLGFLLLIVGAALYPNTRAFRSSMVWVTYRGPPEGPTGFELRAATVRSANFRSRHSRSRVSHGLDPDAASDQARAELLRALVGDRPLAPA